MPGEHLAALTATLGLTAAESLDLYAAAGVPLPQVLVDLVAAAPPAPAAELAPTPTPARAA